MAKGGGEIEYGSPAAVFQRFGGLAATGNLKGALAEVAGSFGLVGTAAGAVGGAALSLAGKMADTLVGAFRATVSAVANLPGHLRAMADGAARLVAEFSPLAAGRYSQAWRDLNAVLGDVLMPVVQASTEVVRFLADTLGGLAPAAKTLLADVIGELRPTFAAAGDVFRQVVRAGLLVYEAFRPLAGAVFRAVNPLAYLTDQLRAVAAWVGVLTDRLALLLGIDLPKFDGSSQGKAFVSTGMTTVSAMLDAIRQRAFQLGPGVKEDKQQKQIDLLTAIHTVLKDGLKPDAIGRAVAAAIRDPLTLAMVQNANQFVQAVKDFPGQIASAVAAALPGGRGWNVSTQLGNFRIGP